jgi:hypothetical protein
METLTSGATYIYEKANGVTYRREMGSMHREAIAWDQEYILQEEQELWKDIVRQSKNNPALQKALDNAIMIYRLIKDDPQ